MTLQNVIAEMNFNLQTQERIIDCKRKNELHIANAEITLQNALVVWDCKKELQNLIAEVKQKVGTLQGVFANMKSYTLPQWTCARSGWKVDLQSGAAKWACNVRSLR